MIYLLSFSTPQFYESQIYLQLTALHYGVDYCITKTSEDLKKTKFYDKHREIFNYEKGYGFWLWKPYYILEALNELKEGDILFYSDSGIKFISSVEPLLELARTRNIVGFAVHRQPNRFWTKRDCFIGMNCDSEEYWNAEQWNSAFKIIQKSYQSLKFAEAYLDYCIDYRLSTALPNQMGNPNLPGFRDHRHVQSIYSLLCELWNVEKFRDPSEYGNRFPMENSKYGQIISHHRHKLRAVPCR